jgi:hypothetical protein
MSWVTRRNIRVNRTATIWLIRRFIDPQAVFLFADPSEVAAIQQREGAKGFDAPGALYPHKDAKGRCSFEALVEEHCPDDAALCELARIVRGADFPEEIHLTPESAGLRTISHGFPSVAEDDQEILEKAMFLYDALYASLKVRREGSAM